MDDLKYKREKFGISHPQGFTAGPGAEKCYHRVVFQEDHSVSAEQEGETLKSEDWSESYWNNPDVRWKRDRAEIHFKGRNDKRDY